MLGDLKKPIIISRVNDFGLGLMSFGATGISSGIGYIEDFKESILIEEGTGYFLKPKYYIPELMTSFNEKALTDVFKPAIGKSLVCNCPFCKGSMDVDYLLTPNVAKGHYLLQKQKQVELLNEMAKPERLRWFNDATIKAESLLRQLKKATKSKYIQYNHFMLWRDSLTQIEKERKAASSFPSVAQ